MIMLSSANDFGGGLNPEQSWTMKSVWLSMPSTCADESFGSCAWTYHDMRASASVGLLQMNTLGTIAEDSMPLFLPSPDSATKQADIIDARNVLQLKLWQCS